MSIIEEIIEFMSVMTDRNIETIALHNVLNAKLCQMVASKNVKFKQYKHSLPLVLSYYGINFLQSGSQKDYVIDLIDKYILDFLPKKANEYIAKYKEKIIEGYYLQIQNDKKRDKKIEEFEATLRPPQINISDATTSAIYLEASQISKIGMGSLFIKISELGDYIDAIVKGDQQKKDFFEKLKDIYDGKIMPRLVLIDKREALYNIPVQILLYSDFDNLLDEKTSDYFKRILKTGMARRCFIYIPKTKRKFNQSVGWEKKEQNQKYICDIAKQLEQIYDAIPENAIYEFNEESKTLLEKYKNECIERHNNLIDEEEDSIVLIDLKESFWKITKLSVVYHVINYPKSTLITVESIEKAIDFYSEISQYLHILLDKKAKTAEDNLYKFLTRHFMKRTTIYKKEIRDKKFVNGNNFSKWFNEIFPDLESFYNLVEYKDPKHPRREAWQQITRS